MDAHCDLFLIEQSQFITNLFAFSKIVLQILPSSDLHGSNNQEGVLVLKFVLCSSSVKNAGFLAVCSILHLTKYLFCL